VYVKILSEDPISFFPHYEPGRGKKCPISKFEEFFFKFLDLDSEVDKSHPRVDLYLEIFYNCI